MFNMSIITQIMCPDPENAKLDHFSVHAVASAVGSFFRELPEPLLTVELYVEFLRAMGEYTSMINI